MPTVGGRSFPYTKAGMRAAKLYAAQTGHSISMKSKPAQRSKPTPRKSNTPKQRKY